MADDPKWTLSRLLGALACAVGWHRLGPPSWVSLQAAKHECKRCGRFFAVKHIGEHAGAVLPWDEEFEEFYSSRGFKRGRIR